MINLENTLFAMPLMVGSIFIIMGFIMLKFPPKKINALYGYRTLASMKTQERWDFSQIYSSKLMIYCGVGLMILSLLGLIFTTDETKGVIISSVFIFGSVGILLYKTQRAIKQNFSNEA